MSRGLGRIERDILAILEDEDSFIVGEDGLSGRSAGYH
jgi:hypothetical protein